MNDEIPFGLEAEFTQIQCSGNDAFNFGYVVASFSFILFYLNTNFGFLQHIAPLSLRDTPKNFWKWRNTANSLIHSSVSGTWAIISFWQTRELRENLIDIYTNSSLTLISFSVGYFIYDFVDMAQNSKSKATRELLVHHILVVLCFGLSMVTRYYNGYALVALLVEINSIFLHSRQLMIIQGWNKDEFWYMVNAYFNIATLIVFRLLNLAWLIQWLSFHRKELSLSVLTLGYVCNTAVMVMNIGLFIRVMVKDYLNRDQPPRRRKTSKPD